MKIKKLYRDLIIVEGPAGCGKTTYAEYLRGIFRKKRVLQDIDRQALREASSDDLVLCNSAVWLGASRLKTPHRIVSFKDAMSLS